MKKRVSLVLAAMLTLSLAACGSPAAPSAEELMAEAQEVDLNELNNMVMHNMAAADQAYAGKNCVVSGYVQEVTGEYCALADGAVSDYSIHAYLPKEELAKLQDQQKVTLVGQMAEVVDASQFPIYEYYTDMDPALLVTDRTELTNEILRFSAINGEPFCQLGGTGVFLPQEVLDTLAEGETIHVSGILTRDDTLFLGDSSDVPPPSYWMRETELLED